MASFHNKQYGRLSNRDKIQHGTLRELTNYYVCIVINFIIVLSMFIFKQHIEYEYFHSINSKEYNQRQKLLL